VLVFESGTVDFSPEFTLVPGAAPNFFPPQEFQPGSVGDDAYTPLVLLSNVAGTPIYNAPIIAFNVSADQINFCDGNPDYSMDPGGYRPGLSQPHDR
jgi:hypothetical protein